MNGHISFRFGLFAVCFFFSGCGQWLSHVEEVATETTNDSESSRTPDDSDRISSTEESESPSLKGEKQPASKLKTPHDYLWNDLPDKALEIMKSDPKWISRVDEDWRTPLHIAARFGHLEVVKWLLENGADVDAGAYNHFTPLHVASDPRVIELILEKRPNLNLRDVQGLTPLQDAAANLVDAVEQRSGLFDDNERRNRKAIVDLYLAAGAEYDVLTAIYLNDLKRVKTILKQTPGLADDFQEQSLLRTAASLGRLETCRLLIDEYRVDVNDFERGVGYPIIKEALKYPEIVRLLVENGADLKTRITWRAGRSGIWIIGDEATALHFAAEDGVPKTIDLLIDSGLDIFATDDKDLTALEVAAFFGKADNAIAILNHANFDQGDEKKRERLLNECLRIAASTYPFSDDRPKLIEALLEKRADPKFTSSNGITAVLIAASGIHPDNEVENKQIKQILYFLLDDGATLDLFSAVAIGDEVQVARLLKKDRKSANSRRPDGYPSLHFAVDMNYTNIVKMLLDAGADVEIRNQSIGTGSNGGTALYSAAFWGRYEIAKLLIDEGANVNALCKKKSTPLHHAARLNNVKVAKLLLDNGARIAARDNDGKTPLDWCRELNKANADEMEKLFRESRQ